MTTCRYCEAASKLMAQASVLERSGADLSCLFSTDARDLLALADDLLEIDRIERGESDPWS